jgi:hypothetical protein
MYACLFVCLFVCLFLSLCAHAHVRCVLVNVHLSYVDSAGELLSKEWYVSDMTDSPRFELQ